MRLLLPLTVVMLVTGGLDAASSGLSERRAAGGAEGPWAKTGSQAPAENGIAGQEVGLTAARLSLSSSRRTIGYGQIAFDGRGPEAWWNRWRKQRREHRRDVAWLKGELAKARPSRSLSSAPPASTICAVFGAYCSEAIRVASCESHLDVNAANGQYLGLFQMGSFARARYGHGADALTQSRAAFAYFVDSGKDWSPWECKP